MKVSFVSQNYFVEAVLFDEILPRVVVAVCRVMQADAMIVFSR